MVLLTAIIEVAVVEIDAGGAVAATVIIDHVARTSRRTGGRRIASRTTVDGQSPLLMGGTQSIPSRTKRP
jgi:hypothetical protein